VEATWSSIKNNKKVTEVVGKGPAKKRRAVRQKRVEWRVNRRPQMQDAGIFYLVSVVVSVL
jgi:hypothetical protein